MKWELFQDMSYFDMWCVRPFGDRDFDSPRNFHFSRLKDARKFYELVQKAVVGEKLG